MRLGSRSGGALRAAIGLLLLVCLLASCGEAGCLGCQKSLGEDNIDEANRVQQTVDVGYAVASHAYSNNSDMSGNHGGSDYSGEINCTITAPDVICSGSTGNVATTAESGASYAWFITNGNITSASTTRSITFTAGHSGTTSLQVIVLKSYGSRSCYKDIAINLPDCSWTSNAPVCNGTAVQFTGPSGMDSYNWSFGDGSPFNLSKDPSHLYQSPGIYPVNLTVANKCGSKYCSGTVEVKLMPDCSWTSNAPVCNGTPVQFSGPAGMDSYQWDFGDGAVSSAKDPNHLYSAPGNYAVNLTVASCGRSKFCTGSVEVRPVPDCSWTSNAPVCHGSPVKFTGPSGMDSYNWSFGDDSPFNLSKDPSHLYRSPGTYMVNLTVANKCGSKYCSGTIEVKPQPDCSWTSNSPVSNGTPVQFTGPAGMDSFQWSFGDGQVSSVKDPAHLYSAPGTYTVSLTVSKEGCSKTCTGSVVVKSEPGECWTSNSPVCNGTPVVFDGPSGMDSYKWNFGDGARSDKEDTSHLYSAPGTYRVSLTMKAANIIKTCIGPVVVKSCQSHSTAIKDANCSWTSSSPVCDGTPVRFDGPSGRDSSQGELGNGQVSSRENKVRIYPG